MARKSFREMDLEEVFDLEDELTPEIGNGRFHAVAELQRIDSDVKSVQTRSEQSTVLTQAAKLTSADSGDSKSGRDFASANLIPARWFQRIFVTADGLSWFPLLARVGTIFLLLVVPLTLLVTGTFDGRISLNSAGSKSNGPNAQPELELKLSAGKARFVSNRASFSGWITSLTSAVPDVELFRLEAGGKNPEGRTTVISGTLRLLRFDPAKPIKGKSDLASGRFTGTVQIDGKDPESVSWIYQPRH